LQGVRIDEKIGDGVDERIGEGDEGGVDEETAPM
jgi:hypothetical protein